MLTLITGKPGMGKTLLMTSCCLKNFKKKNPPLKIWFIEKILRKKYIYDLSEYSDYPIILKQPKKNKKYYYYDENDEVKESNILTSLQFRIFDLILDNKFKDNANFYIDEIQQKYDSMEYKDFPDCIAHYCQSHRHFDNNIYINSQSQSRVIKRILVLCEEYWEIRNFRKIFGYGVCSVRITWDMSANLENGHFGNTNIDEESMRRIVKLKKIGKSYDSKYLRELQKDAEHYKSNMYESTLLNKEILLNSFFPSKDERKRLEEMRY